MDEVENAEALDQLVKQDPRYTAEAYTHMQECVGFAQRRLKARRHLTCAETLEAIRQYTLQSYGPMSRYVLSEWGITNCTDFGNLINNLVLSDLFGKSETDDFTDFTKLGFNFVEAFDSPYKPKAAKIP
jgi:uncharacterized repeat protein (TIGR04138 family)